jgi:hypothetical protein
MSGLITSANRVINKVRSGEWKTDGSLVGNFIKDQLPDLLEHLDRIDRSLDCAARAMIVTMLNSENNVEITPTDIERQRQALWMQASVLRELENRSK